MKVENNLDTDKVRGLVWRLAFPSMLAQFVNVMYSIVDRMYIGNIPEIGALALAGVGFIVHYIHRDGYITCPVTGKVREG